jgi:hypothetical protein
MSVGSLVNRVTPGLRENGRRVVSNDEGQLGVFVETRQKKWDVVFVGEELPAMMIRSR